MANTNHIRTLISINTWIDSVGYCFTDTQDAEALQAARDAGLVDVNRFRNYQVATLTPKGAALLSDRRRANRVG
ncbi:MAG: hypothetical protein GWM98_09705 [Nitrospinaceae bacterium]|nr:hypothetical protein [Nitrospinaceae bacterium]